MSSVDLPLVPWMFDLILSGRKVSLTLPEEAGRPGDRFIVKDQVFVITEIREVDLYTALSEYYDMEGFRSPGAFSKFWLTKIPTLSWNGTENVYVHLFRPSQETVKSILVGDAK